MERSTRPLEIKVSLGGKLRICDHCRNDTFWTDSSGETFCKNCNYNINWKAIHEETSCVNPTTNTTT